MTGPASSARHEQGSWPHYWHLLLLGLLLLELLLLSLAWPLQPLSSQQCSKQRRVKRSGPKHMRMARVPMPARVMPPAVAACRIGCSHTQCPAQKTHVLSRMLIMQDYGRSKLRMNCNRACRHVASMWRYLVTFPPPGVMSLKAASSSASSTSQATAVPTGISLLPATHDRRSQASHKHARLRRSCAQ